MLKTVKHCDFCDSDLCFTTVAAVDPSFFNEVVEEESEDL